MECNKLKILEKEKTTLGNNLELVQLGKRSTGIPLIVGVVHGDEPQGKWLIEKYIENYSKHSTNLLFVPCLNPDGLQLNIRTNANGVDLNRNFPTQNWGENLGDNATCNDPSTSYYGGSSPASETETQFLINIIEKYNPSIILTIHAPYKVVNFDGPAREISEIISSIINYPVEESIGYPTPGSFGTWAGVERNIPTITLELDETVSVPDIEEKIFELFNTLTNSTF